MTPKGIALRTQVLVRKHLQRTNKWPFLGTRALIKCKTAVLTVVYVNTILVKLLIPLIVCSYHTHSMVTCLWEATKVAIRAFLFFFFCITSLCCPMPGSWWSTPALQPEHPYFLLVLGLGVLWSTFMEMNPNKPTKTPITFNYYFYKLCIVWRDFTDLFTCCGFQ